MSTYKVPLTTILEIIPHGNADSLSVYKVYGFEVIGGLNQYKVGDSVIFIPPDSILPLEIEEKVFGKDSKVKLHKSRVRQIRLRGRPSLGLIVSPDKLGIIKGKLEEDYAEFLGIKKYEPPVLVDSRIKGTRSPKPLCNPLLHEYSGIENVKWFPDLFKDEEVIIQTKLHGTNARAAYLPSVANTWKKKLLKFFNMLPPFEYVYGSNRVELTNRSGYTGYYGKDLYGETLNRVKAFEKLKPGETIYGEIIGPGIQANYHYGHKELHFVLFDVKVLQEDGTQKWLNPEETQAYAEGRGFDFVPVIYKGKFDKELVDKLATGKCDYYPEHIKEGVVVKSRYNYNDLNMKANKRALKFINPQYLDDKSNTDIS